MEEQRRRENQKNKKNLKEIIKEERNNLEVVKIKRKIQQKFQQKNEFKI